MDNRATYQAKRQRLAALELRAARYGIDAPAEVVNEIMDLRRELRRATVLNVRVRRFDMLLLSLALILALVVLLLVILLLLIGGLSWTNTR